VRNSIVLFLVLVLLVLVRSVLSRPVYKEGQVIRITTRVTSEPIRYASSQSFNLLGLKISLPLFPEISYGDVVKIEGEVIKGKLDQAKLVGIKESNGFLFGLRKKIIEFYQKSLPEPHSALVAGITLGSKSALPQNFWDLLKKTGTAHVVVASGMNVTMTASFLIGILLLFLNRKKALILAISGIWVYVVLSGLDAPIIRAAIMVSFAYGAQISGRLTNSWRIFFLTGLVMLLIKPSWISDLGFVLSFTATASLMLFEKKAAKLFAKIPVFFREGLTTSLSAQIGVAPILYLAFGQFNILSPIINALILWTVAPIMIIGVAGGIVGLAIPAVGKLILYLAYPMTWWFTNVIKLFAD